MRVQPLQTGSVLLTEQFLHPEPGVRGRLRLLAPGRFTPAVPILAWLIEHEGNRILVDTGEVSDVKNLPFARYQVARSDELPDALAGIGLTPADIDTAIVTHMHSDHRDGAIHVDGPVLVSEDEWRVARSLRGRLQRLIVREPSLAGVEFKPLALDDGPFGAFERSRRLTEDGRVVAVATPGHTAGHISVVAIDDRGRHLLLAGDATDSLEQLLDRRPDAIAPDPALQVETIDRILAHARAHETIFLPAHDRESVARLRAGTTLEVPPEERDREPDEPQPTGATRQ